MIPDEYMQELSAPQLRALARFLNRKALEATARADLLDEREKAARQAQTTRAQILQIPDVIGNLLTGGYGLDAALSHAQTMTGLPLETLRLHWRRFCRSTEAAALAARRLLVARLAARGLTNAEIGARLGLHPVSVSRILGKALHAP